MSNYKKAECPYCRKQTPSGRNVDSPNNLHNKCDRGIQPSAS